MQASPVRVVVLSVLLLLGAGAYAVIGEPVGAGTPRWPSADSVYAASGWELGPEKVEHVNTADFITRVYRDDAGDVATLTIETHQSPKLYAAGPEVPFLGMGYTVTTPSRDVIPAQSDQIGALLAQSGADSWLAFYAYGERRGLLGNGALAWTYAIGDGLLGRQNDYFKLYLVAPADGSDAHVARELSDLARTVFPRIQTWYAAPRP